ncbi:hypothetical protein Hdeb2414_s0005g00153401 [Helianthus debilis subsp. tardiflorus]
MSKSDCDKWLEAMNVEMQSMYDNQVWELVVPPLNSKVVGSKWVFKKKTDIHGNLVLGLNPNRETDNVKPKPGLISGLSISSSLHFAFPLTVVSIS